MKTLILILSLFTATTTFSQVYRADIVNCYGEPTEYSEEGLYYDRDVLLEENPNTLTIFFFDRNNELDEIYIGSIYYYIMERIVSTIYHLDTSDIEYVDEGYFVVIHDPKVIEILEVCKYIYE